MEKECKHCHKSFETNRKNGKYCKECRNSPVEEICSCGKHFMKNVYSSKFLCKECYNKQLSKRLNKNIPLIEQTITCPDCGKIIKKIKIKKVYQTKNIKKGALCKDCHIKHMEEMHNNASQMMKSNNPMFNKETRKKASSTLAKKGFDYLINPATGRGWGFKGLRNLNSTIRQILYSVWTKPILERDHFKCTKCGSTKKLQVHHIRPLREIINLVALKNNVNLESTLINLNTIDNNQDFIRQCVEEHKMCDGITLCKKCHEEEDFYYRPFKGITKDV